MADKPKGSTESSAPSWWEKHKHWTAKGISIASALAADAGLFWLFYFRHDFNPGTATEWFWMRVFVAFAIYAIIQQNSLAMETARTDDISMSLDLFLALTPILVIGGCELWWGASEKSIFALSWRHHVVGIIWSLYAFSDFMATNVVNSRLRRRQMELGNS